MSTDHDRMNLVDAWLREEEHVSAARIVDDVLDQVGSLPQRRVRWAPAWFRDANRAVRLALTTAAAVVIGVVVVSTLAPGRGGLGGPAASLQPSASAPAESSATSQPSPATTRSVWTATGSMLEARGEPTATVLRDGTVLVAGGSGNDDTSLASSELYDPRTGSWTATGSMLEARGFHTATMLPDGRVLVAGGMICDGYCHDELASAELYDPIAGTWTATGNMAVPRGGHTATLLADGTVLVAGGLRDGRELASVEIYDPRTGSWAATGSMLEARGWPPATLLPDGTVLVTGGTDGYSGGWHRLAELYDPRTRSWAAVKEMNQLWLGETATLLLDGTVLVEGEASLLVGPSVMEVYDPSTGSWTLVGSMSLDRYGQTATLLPDGTVLVAGGGEEGGGDGSFLSSAELYDPRSGSWSATASLAEARKGHTAALLLDGTVLVMGGRVGLDPGWIRTATAEVYGPVGGT